MTQTIKERLKLLKKRNPELNEYADNYAQHIYVRNKGFNEGVDACLPLLEEVVRDERERIKRELTELSLLNNGSDVFVNLGEALWVCDSEEDRKVFTKALTDPQ